jgi:hypothetical protein
MSKRCRGCVVKFAILFFVLAGSPLFAQTIERKLPPLNVEKNKLTFDPLTAAVGAHGSVHTGCDGVVVKIVSREKGVCQFTYTTDGCGGVFAYYRGEVAIDAGPVTVDVFNGGIRNSFPDKALTLLRRTGPPGFGDK